MHCANCALTIEKNIRKLKGVSEVNVSFASSKASIEFDPRHVNLNKIEEAVTQAGYRVVYERVSIEVRGLRDSIDASKLEEILGNVDGIVDVSVNYLGGRIYIKYDPTLISFSDIKRIILEHGLEILFKLL